MNDLMLRPLVRLKALSLSLFLKNHPSICCYLLPPFSPHIVFSNYTVVAKMIGTCIIKRFELIKI